MKLTRREFIATSGAALAAAPTAHAAPLAAPLLEKQDLFVGGAAGYAAYRIPGLVVTRKGTLLAYCEARRTAKSDWDAIDIMLRRSTDGGQTWDAPRKIAHAPGAKTKNPVALAKGLANADDVTYNNAVAIPDQKTGGVHFLFCLEYARCFYMHSKDDGATFSAPVEITATFEAFRKQYDWKVLATGPAHGIQLKSGRLVVPIWLSTGTGGHAHRPSDNGVIYSDDSGQTWRAGDLVCRDAPDLVFPSEAVVAQLADGRVLFNARSESPTHRRAISYSPNGATKWTKPVFHEQLLEPICMASLVRLSQKPLRNRLLFANPHNLESADGSNVPGKSRVRKNLSVKLSYDEGATWPVNKTLAAGASGYSDLAVAADGAIFCLYETVPANADLFRTGKLTLARFNLEWLTDGQDSFQRK